MVAWQFMDFSNVDPEKMFEIKDDRDQMHRMLLKHPEFQKILKAEIPRLINMGLLA